MTESTFDAAGGAVPSLAAPRPTLLQGLWRRQLAHYPSTRARYTYLGIVVLATIVLYYELYIPGAVSTQIIASYGISLKYFIFVSVIGNAVGAFASLAAGLADRWGRANLVAYGLLLTALLVLFGLPAAHSAATYTTLFALVSLVEGVILVATPALIRDFSPQLGRASAMGFWTLGPVIGSLVVTEVSSHTLPSHPDWQYQFRVCGAVGLVVFALALVGLRELSPKLRDQLMVSLHDRALIEARAAGLDTEQALKGHWRQMLKLDVVGSAFAISIFLLFYYIAVGFFVVYFATTFGYTPARANSLANWYWISNAIALVVAGVLSDLVKVRKPFMVVGGVVSAIGVAVFASLSTHLDTGYYTFAWLLVLIAAGGGVAYCAWMASFTETVEKHNPAATATGLAVWGWTIRMVVTFSLIGLTFAVGAASVLVDKGPAVQELATKYAPQLATLGKVDPATQAGLATNDKAAQLKAVGEIAGGLSAEDVTKVETLAARYAPQLATLQKLDPATQAALAANPDDQAAQVKALSTLSGVSAADVAKTIALSTRYAQQLQTAQAVDQATLLALAANPADAANQAKAVGQIAQKLSVSPAEAAARLTALGQVPQADLAFLLTTGPTVQQAVSDLTAAGTVPPADLAFLSANGSKVQQAAADLTAVGQIPAQDMAYLSANGAKVQAAQADSPRQWQRWWWVCFAGQLLFLPFIFVMTGRWSPRKARQDAEAHEALVARELASLEQG